MSNFSADVRANFLDFLKRDEIKDVKITASRFPSSIFSNLFWIGFAKKLMNKDNLFQFTFQFPVNIDKSIFEKIESKLNLFTDSANWDKSKISYELVPWINEEVTGRAYFSISGESELGVCVSYTFSKEAE